MQVYLIIQGQGCIQECTRSQREYLVRFWDPLIFIGTPETFLGPSCNRDPCIVWTHEAGALQHIPENYCLFPTFCCGCPFVRFTIGTQIQKWFRYFSFYQKNLHKIPSLNNFKISLKNVKDFLTPWDSHANHADDESYFMFAPLLLNIKHLYTDVNHADIFGVYST